MQTWAAETTKPKPQRFEISETIFEIPLVEPKGRRQNKQKQKKN